MRFNIVEKIKKSVKQLIGDTKLEAIETKELIKLLWAAKSKSLTKEEKAKVKNQSLDVFKLTVLSALFIVPGSGILIIFLVKFGKKFGINVLPSSFDKKENE